MLESFECIEIHHPALIEVVSNEGNDQKSFRYHCDESSGYAIHRRMHRVDGSRDMIENSYVIAFRWRM